MSVIPAPPHTFTKRLIAVNPSKWEYIRLLGWTKDGSEITCERDYGFNEIVTVDMIPAAPGWYVLNWYGGEPDDDPEAEWRLTKQPIVAWKIERSSMLGHDRVSFSIFVEPVPVNGDEDTYKCTLAPDGMVHEYDTETMPLEKWRQKQIEGMKK